MNVNSVKAHCAAYPGAEAKLSAAPSNVLVYSVGGKSFAYFKTSAPEQWRFSIRTTPDRFLELTGVPGIKPARYMGRFHWVTIVNVGSFPEDYLRELIGWSYQRALGSLTKAQQRSIGAQP